MPGGRQAATRTPVTPAATDRPTSTGAANRPGCTAHTGPSPPPTSRTALCRSPAVLPLREFARREPDSGLLPVGGRQSA